MGAEATSMLREWQDFYVPIGTAATLIGLMFVSASIAAARVISQLSAGVQDLLTPIVAHFSANLAQSLLLWHRSEDGPLVRYGLGPMALHLVLVAGAMTVLAQPQLGLDIVAAAQLALPLFGIRNAWDITIWVAGAARQ